ncbi:MAG: general secretion pathway protein [Rhodanobacter sp.]|nr:MAG: general secretion pathway protein [Rhodanobacter sp.]TAL99383.1 MAG: general secretion pathway protein [Rhodanobacter sp.]TAM40561.1 MAG: general secretion pathway protein [Rhodanobacter sp.]TAN28645.1 MAG: general secretion pathway protein [Rhodanobacter sp.]
MTFAAIALLGLVLAHWTWEWLAPRPEPRAPAPAPTAKQATAAAGLFGSAQRDSDAAAATGLAIRLLGIVAATDGHRGYALLQLGAKEVLAVRAGDDVAPGVRLAKVGTDHVVLERGGVRETLAWPKPGVAAPFAAQPGAVER